MSVAWLSNALECLYPGICAVCGLRGEGGRDLCASCARSLPVIGHACGRCALPLASSTQRLCGRCLARPPAYERAFIPYRYEAPMPRLIAGFKFRENLSLARLLGNLLGEFLESLGTLDADCIVPLPLHPKRMRERGFNQAQLIAREVGLRLKLPLDTRCLERIVHRPPQHELAARERRSNMRKVFRANPGSVRSRRIALLDDVVTTGATAEAASRALKAGGATGVVVIALARTP